MRPRRLIAALILLVLCAWPMGGLAAPIPVKVVLLTTFERGADTGDQPGEFQYWAERYPLGETLKVPGIERPVRLSADGVLGVVTGMRGRPRESVAALILDPRFDLSHAYWLVAGIAGIDPKAGSIGSAAWAKWVVDADPMYELDDREIPAAWTTGLFGPGRNPGEIGAPGSSDMVWKLDAGLVDWAYGLTRNIPLADGPKLRKARAGYPSELAAQGPPRVFIGDDLGTTRFWHGEKRTEWARAHVKVWTRGAGYLAMSECEDQGIMDALTLFARDGRVDVSRVLILRTASNYTREPDGGDPVLNFTDGGADAAFEAAYVVGAPVVKALVAGWSDYRDHLPGSKDR